MPNDRCAEDMEAQFRAVFWADFEQVTTYFYVTKFMNEEPFVWTSKTAYADFLESHDIIERAELIKGPKYLTAQLADYEVSVTKSYRNIHVKPTSNVPTAWDAIIRPLNIERLELVSKENLTKTIPSVVVNLPDGIC